MKFINKFLWGLLACGLLLGVAACEKMEDDGEPITNDFRVLQVKFNDNVVEDGVNDQAVIGTIQLICSHGINASAFEGALNISPMADIAISYDESNSFASLNFESPLEYETTYTITLPTGTYGQNGEASKSDFSFSFTTAAFEPPSVSLSTDVNSLFEGEMATITATINRMILEEVSMELTFGGSAMGDDVDYSVSAA
ncbi:MAG: Ig-like domain-containing protein, partial [Saprospiraceae bacterium]|nr:Ig-like domain-containing protein [Saprospiraceae bacterium]